MIFAGINARILASPLADPFYKCNRLINAHRPAGIVAIFFEIEHEQDASRSRCWIGLRPGIGNDAQKMIGLPDRIGRVAVMVGAPEQPGPGRRLLSQSIVRIACEWRVTGLMNYAHDAFGLHPRKIDPHCVVVR